MSERYKKMNKKEKGVLSTVFIDTLTGEELPYKKGLIRKNIEDNIFDIHDSVADNSKMISLMMSMLSRMWSIIPQVEKDNLTLEEIAMIDSTLNMFNRINTRADIAFIEEGMELVRRLLVRQNKIADIIKKAK